MFIDTLEFTIPVDLCNLYMTLQQQGTKSHLDFPASVNSYGTTQDANVQVALRANKVTFKVDGVSSNASIISKSECKTLKLSVFDVDRSLMPQKNTNNSSGMSPIHQPQPVLNTSKRLHEQSVSLPLPPAKSSRTSFSESPRPRSPVHRRSQPQISPRPSPNTQSKSHQNDTPVNVKLEPEDPDLIEIEPDDIVPKKETPYMQIDYSLDVPHTQTSQAASERLSHQQSSHSQSPGSSSSSFHQNVPHAPDYAEPSTSQHVQGQYGDQSADEFLVFQDDNDYGDDNEADYSNDGSNKMGTSATDQFHLGPEGQILAALKVNFGENLPGPRRTFACDRCPKVFARMHGLRYHKRAIHDKITVRCVCGRVYNHQRTLSHHQKSCFPYQIQRHSV